MSVAIDEIEVLRACEYGLLATLLRQAPDARTLGRLTGLRGDATPLGRAHSALAEAAEASSPAAVEREFFDLFVGLTRGELLPYASYYLTGSLNERPLARVRQDLAAIGLEAVEDLHEPEDHIAVLCEVMAGLAGGRLGGACGSAAEPEQRFFARHLKPWAGQFFTDLERAPSARLYQAVGRLGRLFMTIETEGLAMIAIPDGRNGGRAAEPARAGNRDG